jgi:hypothetical protein
MDPKPETTDDRTRPTEIRTYQQALDEALTETFPASDPISPSALEAEDRALRSRADPVDWPLRSAAAAPERAWPRLVLGALAGALLARLLGQPRARWGAALGALLGAAAGGTRARR